MDILLKIYHLLERVFFSNRYTTQDAFVLSAQPVKIMERNFFRVVQNLQNQESVLGYIYCRYGGDGTSRSYFRLDPGSTLIQDTYCPQEELWAYADNVGAILTVVTRSEGEK